MSRKGQSRCDGLLYCDSSLVGKLGAPQLAGIWERFLAALVDLLVTVFGPFFVAFLAGYFMWTFTAIFTWHRVELLGFFAPFIEIGFWIGLVLGVLLVVFYQIKWVYKDGQTIGKKALRIRVVG